MPNNNRRRLSENPVFEGPRRAVDVISEKVNCTIPQAQEILRALIDEGYFIAPRNPTNAMLEAYITSYGPMPKNPKTVITAIGKAKKRWHAMGSKGTSLAMSHKKIECISPAEAESIPKKQ